MGDETSFTSQVPQNLSKESAEKLWTAKLEDFGKYAASYVNAGDVGSVAEAAEVRVLALLQARTTLELTKSTDRLALFTKVLIGVGILQATAVIVAALIVR